MHVVPGRGLDDHHQTPCNHSPTRYPKLPPQSHHPLELQSHCIPNFLMRTMKSWTTGESSRGLLRGQDQKLLWDN